MARRFAPPGCPPDLAVVLPLWGRPFPQTQKGKLSGVRPAGLRPCSGAGCQTRGAFSAPVAGAAGEEAAPPRGPEAQLASPFPRARPASGSGKSQGKPAWAETLALSGPHLFCFQAERCSLWSAKAPLTLADSLPFPFCLPPLLPVSYEQKVPLKSPSHGWQTLGDVETED